MVVYDEKNWFEKGFNCAQAVLLTNAQEYGISQKDCLRLAAGFGGGIARLQRTCGAVTGAIMVIGAKFGNFSENDNESKENTYEKVKEFISEFERINKSTTLCKDILGADLNTEEGREKIESQNLLETQCYPAIANANSILKKLLKK